MEIENIIKLIFYTTSFFIVLSYFIAIAIIIFALKSVVKISKKEGKYMFKEKIKLFYAKNSVLIMSIITLIFLMFIVLTAKNTDVLKIFEELSDTEFAVYGTLLGAVVGGIFTLIGTNFVNKQQLKSQTQIKRKNLIYKPLYEELIEIQCDFMIQNPYPEYISIDKNKTSFPKYSPQYTVWERIKADTRYFEVPKSLKDELNILNKTIADYLIEIRDINKTITDILNKILKSELSTQCTIINIGSVLSKQVLTESNIDIFNQLDYALKPNVEVSYEERERISKLFYESCKQNEKIQAIKNARALWYKQQERTLDLLTTLISFVTIKYEG